MTIGVRFTAKEKIEQEKREDDDIAKGFLNFFDVINDDEGETVMLATILTDGKKIRSIINFIIMKKIVLIIFFIQSIAYSQTHYTVIVNTSDAWSYYHY